MARGWGLFAPALSRVSFVCVVMPPLGAPIVCLAGRFLFAR